MRAILDRARIPYLSGMRTALTAIGYALREKASPVIDVKPVPQPTLEAVKTDVARFKLLADAGLPMAKCIPVTSAIEAARAAEQLGFPVVLKGSAPQLAHKSDLGLVHVELNNAANVEAAY